MTNAKAPPTWQMQDSIMESVPRHMPRVIDSVELLSGDKELQIRHGDEIYRLRLTKNGKLILQK